MRQSSANSRSAMGLMVLAAACAFLGVLLLRRSPAAMPGDHGPQVGGPTTAVSAASPSPARRRAADPSLTEGPRGAAAEPGAASGVPVPGDGPAGDRAVQLTLERTSPADLPRGQEGRLVQLARRVWTADVTGRGREQWPGYFAAHQTAGPRGAYTRVRIQAGIARKTAGSRVEVRLVWAGTDPSGDQRDGRLAVIVLRPVFGHPTHWEPIS